MESDSDKLRILLSADLSTILHLCKINPEFKEVCKKNKNVIRDYILNSHPKTSKNVDRLLQFGGNNSLLVKTADNKKIKLTGNILESSVILKDMLVHSTQKTSIELPFLEKTLNYIFNKKDPRNLDLDTLIEIAKAANYLEIEDYLDLVTTRIAELIQNI